MQISSTQYLLLTRWLCTLTFGLLLASVASAQCLPRWLPSEGIPGVDGNVYAITAWDPDGVGPQPHKLVVAGDITGVGNLLVQNIATYDFTSGVWSALGTVGGIRALAALPNGELFAGGYFTLTGAVGSYGIARWNGSAWLLLGSGMDHPVNAIAVLPNGDLIAGGEFTIAGGVAAARVARWDGVSWSAMGSGMNASVRSLTVLPEGELIAGGLFTTAGGIPAARIARWNDASWSPLGSGIGDGAVNAVAAIPAESGVSLVAAGTFSMAGGVSARWLASWNGSNWSPMVSQMTGFLASQPQVHSLAVGVDGQLFVAGAFQSIAGVTANCAARWNGSEWQALGSGLAGTTFPAAYALSVLPSGDVAAGGLFTTAGGESALGIAHWRSHTNTWSALAPGFDNIVHCLTTLQDGSLVIGGEFDHAGTISARRIARWDGSTWSPLGSGIAGKVFAVIELRDGSLLAGGEFGAAGGTLAQNIARWDGSAWMPLGGGLTGGTRSVFALAELPDGDIIAGGSFTTAGGMPADCIAKWNGSEWSPLGSGLTGPSSPRVNAIAVLPDGTLVAGGYFTSSDGTRLGSLARWDGTTWSAFGNLGLIFTQTPAVNCLAVAANGDLVAGGTFDSAGGVSAANIARWDGDTWWPFGDGIGHPNPAVKALAFLSNGDLIASGRFSRAGGVDTANIARWNGLSWVPLANGVATRQAVAIFQGDVIAGGYYGSGVTSAYFARCTYTGVAPTLEARPSVTPACPGGSVIFTVAADGTGPMQYRWEVDVGAGWRSLANGALIDSRGFTVATVADSTTRAVSLRLNSIRGRFADGITFRAVATNTCGSTTGVPVILELCIADVNCTGGNPTVGDLLDFISWYFIADPRADMNGDARTTVQDLFSFLTEYFVGCA